MDAEVLKVVAEAAGIGGLALGVFLILFREIIRKKIFPRLPAEHAYRLLRLLSILIFLIAGLGIVAWVWVETHPRTAASAAVNTGIANTGTMKVDGDIKITGGAPAKPGN